MLYITVAVSASVEAGDVLNWNSSNSKWELGSDTTQTFGVARENAYSLDEGINYMAKVTFAGQCYAKAGSTIPDEGGKLSVVNGKVVVDNSSVHEVGFVAPLGFQQESRLENELVIIYIR